MKIFILVAMIFCHIVDDYYLQGFLASAKQKEWWEKNAPNPLYKNDYIIALIMHSISWAFMIMLPISLYLRFQITWLWCVVFVINIICHGWMDNLKANLHKANLWQDQLFHGLQIIITYAVFIAVEG